MAQPAYSSSDANLRAAILAAFAADHHIASANLRVGVLNSIAHLAGAVDSLVKRAAAEELARQISGVRGIVNRIEAPGAPNPARTVNLCLQEEHDGSDESWLQSSSERGCAGET